MFKTLINAFKNKDVRTKILITIGLLFIYRIGCWIPVPGISADAFSIVEGSTNILGLLSTITGGALQNGAFLAIGISPYINATIILQLLTIAIPALERLSKQGDEGKKKLNMITRIFTLVLGIAQATGIVVSWGRSNGLSTVIFGETLHVAFVGIFVVLVLVAGSMLSMWMGERITELGVGNGISLLIFLGIISSAGLSIIAVITQIFQGGEAGNRAVIELVGFAVMAILIFAFIVFIDLSERKIPIQYAKQIKGRKQYGGQSTHIPIKVNATGVLPIIFSTAMLSFPQLIMSMFLEPNHWFLVGWSKYVGAGSAIYSVLVGLLILFFSYFYAQIQFKPDEVSRNIQQYGGFIPGIRPGKPTTDYLGRVSKRLTLFGAIFLAFIAIVPSLIFSLVLRDATLVNAFSATGLLIVVSVALEFDKQLQSLLMMKQYKGFLK